METPILRHIRTIVLPHRGDCSLIGVAPNLALYTEEVYGEEGWIAQHAFSFEGELLASVDEDSGANEAIQPLPLPDSLVKPRSVWQTMNLNCAGPRWRGLRGPERLPDMLRALSVQDKISLTQRLGLAIPPPLLLGIAESYVTSEVLVDYPDLYFVCRRLRLAYALPEPQVDADNQPYDYDTLLLHTAHWVDKRLDVDLSIHAMLETLPGTYRPMDCTLVQGYLFIADGGGADRECALHIFQVEGVDFDKPRREPLEKRLYG